MSGLCHWRRGGDSNPRDVTVRLISSPLHAPGAWVLPGYRVAHGARKAPVLHRFWQKSPHTFGGRLSAWEAEPQTNKQATRSPISSNALGASAGQFTRGGGESVRRFRAAFWAAWRQQSSPAASPTRARRSWPTAQAAGGLTAAQGVRTRALVGAPPCSSADPCGQVYVMQILVDWPMFP